MTLDIGTIAEAGLFVNRSWAPGGNGRFDDVSPGDGSVLATIADGGVVDVLGAVQAARTAFDSGPWPRMSPAVSAPVLGATKPHHIDDAIAALDITLDEEQTAPLETPYRPHPVIGHNRPSRRSPGRKGVVATVDPPADPAAGLHESAVACLPRGVP
ncbi:hypothetical protein ACIBSV_06985 [Embleya sp. NPDC050154]|uniref:hypothetical protein n=1 Tax=Embleya sp. NPDC050154 TaxID=3363988 RepID=UPI003791D150